MNGRIKALFDITVLTDALASQRQEAQASVQALTLAANGRIDGYLCASALEALYTTLSSKHGKEGAKERIQELRHMLAVAPVSAAVVDAAIALDSLYLDDAVTIESARVNGLDLIVTLNAEDFTDPALPALEPGELLQRLGA